MFITDKNQLAWYTPENRVWQGIPSIERSAKGRLFLTFYSGFTCETYGNYVLLLTSDDDGKRWAVAAAVDKPESVRYFDPEVWIDPLGRLWLSWAKSGSDGSAVYTAICDDPDAPELQWHDPVCLGGEVMLNKPTVLSTGEWLFPISIWPEHAAGLQKSLTRKLYPLPSTGAYVCRSCDQGRTFENIGVFHAPNRLFDEHMFVELRNGVIMIVNRTANGIYKGYSYDGGRTWSEPVPFDLPSPSTRIYLRHLRSGRLVCIHNDCTDRRANLTVRLSDDDGLTWSDGLLLDERNEVSYPDATEDNDGFLYITYDRERGGFKQSWEENQCCAKEILIAKVTEEDILAGKLTNPQSYLKKIASKLTAYTGDRDYYAERQQHFDRNTRDILLNLQDPEEIVTQLIQFYLPSCDKMVNLNAEKADALIRAIFEDTGDLQENIDALIHLFCAATKAVPSQPVVNKAIAYIRAHTEDDYTAEEMAQELGISAYYLSHLFKAYTGMTPVAYKNACRIQQAKQMLYATELSVSEIAMACGFNSQSYFVKKFREHETLTPSAYRSRVKGC